MIAIEKIKPAKKMHKKKMLITGSSGQVGSLLYKQAQETYDVIGVAKEAHQLVDVVLDITDAYAWKKYLEHVKPDVIVHTAALTWVDYSEDHQEETDRVNIAPIETLTTYVDEQKEKPYVVFISSDYVYDGKKKEGKYTEDDPVNPVNYYGISKVKGEERIRKLKRYCILRTGVVFSWHPEGKNFFMQTYTKMKAGETMKVVDDQISNPTYAPSLVTAILKVIEKNVTGTFNATGPETFNRYAFAQAIVAALRLNATKLHLAKTTDFSSTALRPMNDGTDSSRLYAAIGWTFPSLEENFKDIKNQLHDQ